MSVGSTTIELSPNKGAKMTENKKFCNDCEVELTADNTEGFGGFDGGNYLASQTYGGGFSAEVFTKCDSCFEGDIDRHLDNQYN